jgi:predicted  nucleic acid-binding Zn-ribbon protein
MRQRRISEKGGKILKTFDELQQELEILNEKSARIKTEIKDSELYILSIGREIAELIADGGEQGKVSGLQSDRTALQTMTRDLRGALETLSARKATAEANIKELEKEDTDEAFNLLCDERTKVDKKIERLMNELVLNLDILYEIADKQDLIISPTISDKWIHKGKTRQIVEHYLTYKLKDYISSLGRVLVRMELSEADQGLRAKR